MLKRISRLYGLLAALGVLGLAVPAEAQQAYTITYIQGHRCLIAGPAEVPDDAPVVFILHGLGANANDLFPMIQAMNLPPCKYVLPDGPITVGDHAYAWYDLQTQSRSDMVKSRNYLFGLMRLYSTEGEKPGRVRPIIMTGFSQGGVMSLEAGLNYKGKVEAIVCMSGYIWYPGQTLAHPFAPSDIPILMVHGTNDMTVIEDWTQKTVKALKKAGFKPIFKEFPMGHTITRESLAEVTQFLQNVLKVKN
jgi:phospholipase/carboxylesterase